MRRVLFATLIVILAGAIHLDWHLARPAHHRLSLGWGQHWLFAATAFALVGWLVARAWPEDVWRRGTVIATLAVVLAQGLEPMGEVALALHRLGYPDDPARWTAFFVCVATGVPAYLLALWWCRPRREARTMRSPAPEA